MRARRAIGLADPRAESPLESFLRLVLIEGGLPPEDLQHELADEDGRTVARVDIWYDGVAVEADGFAFHRERASYRRDRWRAQELATRGVLYLPYSWEDVSFAPARVVMTSALALAARSAG